MRLNAGVPAGTLHAIAARVPTETLTAATPVNQAGWQQLDCPVGGTHERVRPVRLRSRARAN